MGAALDSVAAVIVGVVEEAYHPDNLQGNGFNSETAHRTLFADFEFQGAGVGKRARRGLGTHTPAWRGGIMV